MELDGGSLTSAAAPACLSSSYGVGFMSFQRSNTLSVVAQ